MAAHRHWRIYVTADVSDQANCAIAEIQMRSALGGADQTGSGTASASSTNGANAASRAFDNSASTYWLANSPIPQWIAYDFGAGNDLEVVEILLTTRNDSTGPARIPHDFDVQGSDDGSAWTTAWSVVAGGRGIDWIPWAIGETRQFSDPSLDATALRRAYAAGVYIVHGQNERRAYAAGLYVVRGAESGPTAPTADTIAVELDSGLGRINVTEAGTGDITDRTLEASLTVGFASFDTVAQYDGLGEPTTDPAETLIMWHPGDPGTEVFYRSRVTGPGGSTVSNVVSQVFPSVPAAAKPTIEILGVDEDSVFARMSAPDLPEGHVLAAAEWTVRLAGAIIATRSVGVVDPEDPDEPWREVEVDELGPSGASLTIEGRYLSNSTPEDEEPTIVAGVTSDAEPFTLLVTPTPGLELDGVPEAGDWVYHREWPISQWHTEVQYPPKPEDFNSFYVIIRAGGVEVHRRRTTGATGFHGALIPGIAYTFEVYASWYVNPFNWGYTEVASSIITPPLALDAPYLDTIGGAPLRSGKNFSGEVEVALKPHDHPAAALIDHDPLVAGPWPIEVTRDRGATWERLTEDAREVPYTWDLTVEQPTRAQLRYRAEPAEGGPSPWRYSKPFYLNRGGFEDDFVHRSGLAFQLADFTPIGNGEFEEIGDSDETRRIGFGSDTGATVGGALQFADLGEPRSYSTIVEGEYASGASALGPIGGFFADMQSAWGPGAYLSDSPPTGLLGRVASGFGSWGGWIQNLIGEGSWDWWRSVRYGGSGSHRPSGGVILADFTSAFFGTALGSSGRQWLGGSRSAIATPLHPTYSVETRYTLLATNLDGSHQVRVEVYLHGPEWDAAAAPQVDKIRTSQTWPCAPCGIHAKARGTILFYGFTADVDDYGSCALPLGEEPPEAVPGRPCALEYTHYEADGITPAWMVSDTIGWGLPYLQTPREVGEQRVSFVEGRATIGLAHVSIIDPPQIEGDKQSGWLTERIQDVIGNRGRLRRWIDEELGWVTIADGPCSAPKMSNYPLFTWSIRDTRERERRLRAFVHATDFQAFPRGIPNGFGQYGEGQYVVAPATAAKATFFNSGWDLSAANPRKFIALKDSAGAVLGAFGEEVPANIAFNEAVGKLFDGIYDASNTDQEWEYPDLIFYWRPDGSTDPFTAMPGVTMKHLNFTVPGMSGRLREGNLLGVVRERFIEGTEDNPVIIDAVHSILGDWHDPATLALAPAHDTDIECYFDFDRAVFTSPEYPHHREGLTAGQLLKNLYDGLYSPRDEDGEIIPTGIRYDEAGLLAIDTPVTLRLTERVDDGREWAEKHIYGPLGYAPALDHDGRVSPVSSAMPTDPEVLAGLKVIDNAVTVARPSWEHAQNVKNFLDFRYQRVYPHPSSDAIDGLVSQPVELQYAETVSVLRHSEQKQAFESHALVALGPAGLTLEEETGYLLALERYQTIIDRRRNGTPVYPLLVRRSYIPQTRVGDWVRLQPTWMPDYATRRRGLDRMAQILGIQDMNCAWRMITVEDVTAWFGPGAFPAGPPPGYAEYLPAVPSDLTTLILWANVDALGDETIETWLRLTVGGTWARFTPDVMAALEQRAVVTLPGRQYDVALRHRRGEFVRADYEDVDPAMWPALSLGGFTSALLAPLDVGGTWSRTSDVAEQIEATWTPRYPDVPLEVQLNGGGWIPLAAATSSHVFTAIDAEAENLVEVRHVTAEVNGVIGNSFVWGGPATVPTPTFAEAGETVSNIFWTNGDPSLDTQLQVENITTPATDENEYGPGMDGGSVTYAVAATIGDDVLIRIRHFGVFFTVTDYGRWSEDVPREVESLP